MKNAITTLSLAALLAAPVAAGVVYEIEVKDHEQSPPTTELMEAAVEGKNLKMGVASGGKGAQGTMIFRGDRREMVVVDNEKRTYSVLDQAAIGQLASQLGQVSKMMEDALKNVPEDKRAMVEQMMKQRMPEGAQMPAPRSESVLTKTGERGNQNGYPCVKYEVTRDGRKIREMWVTDWSNMEGGSDVVDAFEGMSSFFKELLAAMPDFGAAGGPRMDDNVFEHMKELGGFPVLAKEFADDGSLESESALRSARRQSLDPDAFEPPAGYKRQEMFSPQ